MEAYLTKNKNGIVFLWNNKPEYNKFLESYMAWESGHEEETFVDAVVNLIVKLKEMGLLSFGKGGEQ